MRTTFHNFLSEYYRYGFNGMEKDDEVKGGGNSYDFGARMYDSRIGRWLSIDGNARKQPMWSPYKMAKDNPLLYKDPDGNTEYVTITITSEKTGESIQIKMKNDGLIATDGNRHKVWLGLFEDNYYYDFETNYNYLQDKEGNLVLESKKVKVLNKGIVKEKETAWFWNVSYGTTMNDADEQGGMYLTSKKGEGAFLKGIGDVGNAVDVDGILALFKSYKNPIGTSKLKSKLTMDGSSQLQNGINQFAKSIDIQGKIIGYINKGIDAAKNDGTFEQTKDVVKSQIINGYSYITKSDSIPYEIDGTNKHGWKKDGGKNPNPMAKPEQEKVDAGLAR